MFSMNIDEATTSNMGKKTLNVVICFLDDDTVRVITQHLASSKVNVSALMMELQCYDIEWTQVDQRSV